MIGIQLEGDSEFIETEPSTSISLKLENPIFGDAEKLSPGSYSLPFDIPGGNRSPSNAAKLKNPDVIENNEAYQLQKAKLFFDVIPFKSGNLKAKSSSADKISTYFTFGLNSISERFKKAKLREVVDETITIPVNATKKIFVQRTGDQNSDWSITINGKSYQGEHLAIVVNKVNSDGKSTIDTGKYVPYISVLNTNYIEIYPARWYNGVDVIGQPIQAAYPSTNPTVGDISVEILTTGEYTAWTELTGGYHASFASFVSGFPTSKLCFPVLFNENPYESGVLKTSYIVNGVNAAGLISNDANWGFNNGQPLSVRNHNSLQPFLYLKWVIDRIADEFDFEIEGDFYTSTALTTLLIDNSILLDTPLDFPGKEKFIFWRNSFNINELVPDITVVAFLKAIQSRYNLAVYYNDLTRKVRMQFREPIAKSYTHEDVTDISSPITSIEDNRLTGLNLIIDKDDTDLLSVQEIATIGTPEVDIKIECGRLHAFDYDVINSALVEGVKVSRKINAKFPFRVFHYRGIVNNGTFSYHGSSLNVSSNDYSESLLSIFPTGLYERFWLYWLRFQKNRLAIKLNINLPLRRLLDIDYELKRRFDRNDYLIKSLDVKITNQGMSVTNAELYTMR